MQDSILIPPGHETHLAISATPTSTSASLRNSLDPMRRQCYFRDEYHLMLFRDYTVNNCWMECLMNLSMHMMTPRDRKCVPWNFPMDDHDIMHPCLPRDRYVFLENFRKIEMAKIVGTEICLPNCGGTTYATTASMAPLKTCDETNLGLSLLCHLGPRPRDGPHGRPMSQPLDGIFGNETVKDGLAVATFYFASHVVTELSRSPRLSMIDFISQVGGLFGLCLGFSFLSGVEIIYWLVVVYLRNKFQDGTMNRKTSSTVVETMSNYGIDQDIAENNVKGRRF